MRRCRRTGSARCWRSTRSSTIQPSTTVRCWHMPHCPRRGSARQWRYADLNEWTIRVVPALAGLALVLVSFALGNAGRRGARGRPFHSGLADARLLQPLLHSRDVAGALLRLPAALSCSSIKNRRGCDGPWRPESARADVRHQGNRRARVLGVCRGLPGGALSFSAGRSRRCRVGGDLSGRAFVAVANRRLGAIPADLCREGRLRRQSRASLVLLLRRHSLPPVTCSGCWREWRCSPAGQNNGSPLSGDLCRGVDGALFCAAVQDPLVRGRAWPMAGFSRPRWAFAALLRSAVASVPSSESSCDRSRGRAGGSLRVSAGRRSAQSLRLRPHHAGRLTRFGTASTIARSQPSGYATRIDIFAGENWWPLPWYLRRFSQVRWWSAPPRARPGRTDRPVLSR